MVTSYHRESLVEYVERTTMIMHKDKPWETITRQVKARRCPVHNVLYPITNPTEYGCRECYQDRRKEDNRQRAQDAIPIKCEFCDQILSPNAFWVSPSDDFGMTIYCARCRDKALL